MTPVAIGFFPVTFAANSMMVGKESSDWRSPVADV